MRSPRFVTSIYSRRFQYSLLRHHRLLCFYSPPLEGESLRESNQSSTLPPPMAPELLSPMETKRLMWILQAVLRIANAPPKDAASLDLRVSILQSVCMYARIFFDPFSPYTVDSALRTECQSALKQLVVSLPLEDVVDTGYVALLRKECSRCCVCFNGVLEGS